jgi:hypothetical protein
VTLLNGFAPKLGDRFDLFDFTSFSGAFATLNLPTLSGGLTWDASALSTSGELVAVPEPASLSLLIVGAGSLLVRRRRA